MSSTLQRMQMPPIPKRAAELSYAAIPSGNRLGVVGKKIAFLLPIYLCLVTLFTFSVNAGAADKSLTELFKKVKDSVVVIHTVERGWQSEEKKIVSARGIGSGVIISKDGLVMTAAHVVQVADALEVHFRDGTRSNATIVSSSPRTDLALLKLDSKNLSHIQVAETGDSQRLQVGDGIFAIGSPHGIAYTLTSGHVSNILSTGIPVLHNTEIDVILTDAGIDVGNSGGPLFDMEGKVVGIISQFFPFEEKRGAMGAAVSIHSAKATLLRDQPFWSGMELYLLPRHLAKVFNLPSQGSGFLIQRVAKGSPAEKAGLKAGKIRANLGSVDIMIGGDVIIAVDGIKVTGESSNTVDIVECLCENSAVELTILRGGERIKVQLQAQNK